MTPPMNLKRKLDSHQNILSSKAVATFDDSTSIDDVSDRYRAKRARVEPELEANLNPNIDHKLWNNNASQPELPQDKPILTTDVLTAPGTSKRAILRAIIIENGHELGSNDKAKGTVRYTSEGYMEYLMTEDPKTWVGAIYHNDIRGVLIEENNTLGEYDHHRQQGLNPTDVTCYNATQKSWGPNRLNWPEVLFRIYVDKTVQPKDKVKIWYRGNKVVLDSDRHAMRVFDIPATISSQIEDFILVAMMHSDSRLKISDIRGRMPDMARITSKNGEKLETLKSLNALSMMMTRFRLKAALLPRERRSGSKEIEKGLRAILPTSCFQSSPPSTRQFGRFLTDREVKALQEPNKGNFAYRKRAGNDVSVAKEPKDTKISSKRKHDPSPQYLDALLMEAEDTTDSVPRKKTACKGRARENLPSQVEGKISNQPEEMETAAGPLTPWEAFKSDFLDPELTSLFPEYLAGMENTPNFPEHFPEQYPSQAVAENSDQIFSGSLHAVPKPSIRNDHDWVQMESNSAIWLVDNKKVSAIHGGPTKHQCLEGPSTEAEPMTDFQPLAGMIGANRSRNMLYAGTQSPPFSQLMYNFSTEQYEPFEETSATSYGLNQYPGQDDGLFTDPGAADCYGEGSANFYQHGDMSEQSGNESLKPYLNSPDRSEQHRGLPTEDETLISLLSDFNDSHEYPAHPGYAPEKQWTLDDFINP